MSNPPGPGDPNVPGDDGRRDDEGWTDPWATPSRPAQPEPQPEPHPEQPAQQPEQPAEPAPPPPYGQPYGQSYEQLYEQPSYPQQPGYGQPAYGQPGYPPPGMYGYPAPPTNGKAQAALWSGIGSLVLFWCCGLGVLGIVPLVLGVKARSEIRATGGQQGGDGMALAGIVTGSIAIVLGLLTIVLIIVAIASGDTGGDGFSQTRV
ncbi:MAG: DUF4190 domain-containing protein [Nocardioidaceae bacterium]|nr:DUF4190 domain-containing protein [Nocardioidaceae bacterium]NUS51471.1 DUF4190 domain-containing protein [Nocardioidaceae bacterium]